MGSERRIEPRYTKRVAAMVRNLGLYTANVSLNGAQLVCPQASLPRIETALGEARFATEFSLPNGQTVVAQARVAYVSATPRDILIGLRLENFAGDGASHWQRYIARLPEPDP